MKKYPYSIALALVALLGAACNEDSPTSAESGDALSSSSNGAPGLSAALSGSSANLSDAAQTTSSSSRSAPASSTAAVPPASSASAFVPMGDAGVFTDTRDKRRYHWVQIGTQYWMATNLAWSPASDPTASALQGITYATTGPFAYNYDFVTTDAIDVAADSITSGYFYTQAAAQTACPVGWHLPTQEEYRLLWSFINKDLLTGSSSPPQSSILKSRLGWSRAYSATDTYGFSALPAHWGSQGDSTLFWTSTNSGTTSSMVWLDIRGGNYFRMRSPDSLGNVRCLADVEEGYATCGKTDITNSTTYQGVKPGSYTTVQPSHMFMNMAACPNKTIVLKASEGSCGCFAKFGSIEFSEIEQAEFALPGGQFDLYSTCDLSCK